MKVAAELTLQEVTWHAESDRYGYFLPPDTPTSMLLSPEHTFTLAVTFAEYPVTVMEIGNVRQQRADVDRRARVAARFVRRAEVLPGVRAARVSVEPDLVVTVFTEDRDMERDLQLHAMFADEAQELPGTELLQVRIHPADES